MSVLTRSALEASPLADLHTLASELGLDGYRRLRKADLIDAIVERSGGEIAAPSDPVDDAADEPAPRPRRSRGGRGRSRRTRDADEDDRDGADRADDRETDDSDADDGGSGTLVEGVIELLGNGSGFLRVAPPDPSDDDVYVSAAQVRRCELVGGDRVTGPIRPPRRSERYPSLVRIDTINGRPADEVAEGTHFEDLPCEFPTERFALGSDDPTLNTIEMITPIGRGSRVTITGAARAGKTEALRRLAVALGAVEGLETSAVLAGARPEEIADWTAAGITPVTTAVLGSSADAQGQAVERALDTAKRIAARGGHAAVLIDGLDGLHPPVARKALAAARAIRDGGTLTVIAAASAPVGGETTVIGLDVRLTSTGRIPAIDLVNSGTLHPERLVGEAGAETIASARATALGQI